MRRACHAVLLALGSLVVVAGPARADGIFAGWALPGAPDAAWDPAAFSDYLLGDKPPRPIFGLRSQRRHVGDISAGAEYPARAAQDHHATVRLACGCRKLIGKPLKQRIIDCVQHVWPIERDGAHCSDLFGIDDRSSHSIQPKIGISNMFTARQLGSRSFAHHTSLLHHIDV